jgi:hypothetical protein
MHHKYNIEELLQPLATISEILFKRLQCMECNRCEPCGEVFMQALRQLAEAGQGLEAGARGSETGEI